MHEGGFAVNYAAHELKNERRPDLRPFGGR